MPMAFMRSLDHMVDTNHDLGNLMRFITDWVVGRGIKIEEYEHIYDGQKQEKWQRFLNDAFGSLVPGMIRNWLTVGYCPITFLPDSEYGFRPQILELSETDHEIRGSPVETLFRYKVRMRHGSGTGGQVIMDNDEDIISGVLGAKEGTNFHDAVRTAYGLDSKDREPAARAMDTYLEPEARRGQLFRPRPRIFTSVFESPPTQEHGPRSRVISALSAVRTGEFFMMNAKRAETAKRRAPLFVRRPIPPPANDPNLQIGAALGADAASEICPSGITRADAYQAGISIGQPHGIVPTASRAWSAIHEINVRNGALNALKRADEFLKRGGVGSGSGIPVPDGFRPDDGDGFGGSREGGIGADENASSRFIGPRSFGDALVFDLPPGSSIDRAAPADGHDDPIRVMQDYVVNALCNAFGVSRMLFEHGATNRSKTTASGENDPAYKVFRRNIDRISTKLQQDLNEIYRQAYLIEIASIIANRPFNPSPWTLQMMQTEREEKRKSSIKIRKQSRAEMSERLALAMRRRALNALFAESETERKEFSAVVDRYTGVSVANRYPYKVDTSNAMRSVSPDGAVPTEAAAAAAAAAPSSSSSSPGLSFDEEALRRIICSKSTVFGAAKKMTGNPNTTTNSLLLPIPGRPPEQSASRNMRKLLVGLATALSAARASETVDAAAGFLDEIFGRGSQVIDVESLLHTIHTIQDDIALRSGEDLDDEIIPPPSTSDRIDACRITVSLPAQNSFAGISFVERLGYLRPGAYKRVVHEEFGLPLSDMYDEPKLPAGAVEQSAIHARGMSRNMASQSRLTSTAPTAKKDDTPKMPLVDANRVKRQVPNNKADDSGGRLKKKEIEKRRKRGTRDRPSGRGDLKSGEEKGVGEKRKRREHQRSRNPKLHQNKSKAAAAAAAAAANEEGTDAEYSGQSDHDNFSENDDSDAEEHSSDSEGGSASDSNQDIYPPAITPAEKSDPFSSMKLLAAAAASSDVTEKDQTEEAPDFTGSARRRSHSVSVSQSSVSSGYRTPNPHVGSGIGGSGPKQTNDARGEGFGYKKQRLA